MRITRCLLLTEPPSHRCQRDHRQGLPQPARGAGQACRTGRAAARRAKPPEVIVIARAASIAGRRRYPLGASFGPSGQRPGPSLEGHLMLHFGLSASSGAIATPPASSSIPRYFEWFDACTILLFEKATGMTKIEMLEKYGGAGPGAAGGARGVQGGVAIRRGPRDRNAGDGVPPLQLFRAAQGDKARHARAGRLRDAAVDRARSRPMPSA